MIYSKTPYRISFFGGGTDYPQWYLKHGGKVLSTTIDKYCYISLRSLPPFFPHHHRIVYSVVEEVKRINDINHPSVKAIFNYFKIKEGLEMHYDGDLPAKSGLGSSSSFTVGLINLINFFYNKKTNKKKLALLGLEIEQNILKESVGSQDQIAAAYGGLNIINFSENGSFNVTPLDISKKKKNELEESVILCFTGIARFAPKIAKKQIENINLKSSQFQSLHYFVDEAEKILKNNKYSINDFAKLLLESWNVKKKLADELTNQQIDSIFSRGIESGATGGKLLGAGAGGFLMFIVPPNKQNFFLKQMSKFICLPIKFEKKGSQIFSLVK